MLTGSSAIQGQIEKYLQGTDSAVFIPQIVLVNPNTGFSYEPRQIKGIVVQCEFHKTYMTTYTIEFDARPNEQTAIMNNMNGLIASVVLQPIDPMTLQPRYDQDQIQWELKSMVSNQQDLVKCHGPGLSGRTDTTNSGTPQPQNQLQAEHTVPVTLELLEPDAHRIRHITMNSMFNDTNMQDVLHWASQQLKAEKVNITPPDNQEKLTNVIIPPGSSVKTLFPYLQERNGCYSKGLGFYFCHKTMYVYPLYSHDRSSSMEPGIVHVISGPKDYLKGLKKYHSKQGDDLFIVSTSTKKMMPLNTQGTENVGNCHITAKADKMRDKWAPKSKNGDVIIPPDNIAIVSPSNSAGNMDGNSQNAKYKGGSSNPFTSSSQFAMADGMVLSLGWERAIPDIIKPGHHLVYHYDGEQAEYKTQEGTILSVTYTGSSHKSNEGDRPWLCFNASITAHMTSDQQSPGQIQRS